MEKEYWLLAVSGGPDSIALFYMMLEKNVNFAVATVNYHTRSTSSEETNYVKELCDKHHITCHIHDSTIHWTYNFEAQARDIRYQFFKELIHTYHYTGVMVAHHQDDLIETYLLQKQKGITPTTYGLAEKTYYQDMLVYRPLLSYTKDQLVTYCNAHNYVYYIDETNLSDSNARSYLRNHTLKDITVEYRKQLLIEIREANTQLTKLRSKAAALIDSKGIQLKKYLSSTTPLRLTTLRLYLSDYASSLSDKHLQEIDHIVHQNDFCIPFYDYVIYPKDEYLMIDKAKEKYCYEIQTIDDVITLSTKEFSIVAEGKTIQKFSVDDSDFPLTIRSFHDGDSIHMRFGHKKLSRFFIDRHIPLYLRDTWLVIENSKKKVIFVDGLGCDIDHFTKEKVFYLCKK